MKYDDVVIGGGIAGLFSAYLLRRAGRSVCLLAKGFGNLYASSSCIDKLGYCDELATNNLGELPPDHPYQLVGEQAVAEAFGQFIHWSREFGLFYCGDVKKNILLPTAIGTLRPTCLYPETLGRDITAAKNIMVVDIKECIDFHGKLVAENLRTKLPDATVEHCQISINYGGKRQLNTFDIANCIDDRELQRNLLAQLSALSIEGKFLLLPAVLGIDEHEMFLATLESRFSCQVLEVPTLPPSILGIRLYNKMVASLKSIGVKILLGSEVVGCSYHDKKVQGVEVAMANGRNKLYSAENYLLAAGGVLSGGVVIGADGVAVEPIFKLPVVGAAAPLITEMFARKSQGISTLGVMVSPHMQTEIAGVYAMGAMLAGYDPYLEKSGNGVALATSYRACQTILGGK